MLICLHIGAHKTASTYVQSKLMESVERLSDAGVGFVAHEQFRKRISDRLDAAKGLGLVSFALTVPGLRRAIRKMAADNAERRRLILSDENLAGPILGAIGPSGLYPSIRPRLAAVLGAFPKDAEVKVFFSVRNYARFYSSIYAYRTGMRQAHEIEQFRACALNLRRGWTEVVADICKVAGAERTVVWPYEEFAARPALLSYALLGDWKPRLFSRSDKASLPSLSRKGLAVLERSAEILSEREHSALARVVARFQFDRPDEKFSLFDPEEVARLTERYERDLAAIEALGCRLRTPEPPHRPPAPQQPAPEGKKRAARRAGRLRARSKP